MAVLSSKFIKEFVYRRGHHKRKNTTQKIKKGRRHAPIEKRAKMSFCCFIFIVLGFIFVIESSELEISSVCEFENFPLKSILKKTVESENTSFIAQQNTRWKQCLSTWARSGSRRPSKTFQIRRKRSQNMYVNVKRTRFDKNVHFYYVNPHKKEKKLENQEIAETECSSTEIFHNESCWALQSDSKTNFNPNKNFDAQTEFLSSEGNFQDFSISEGCLDSENHLKTENSTLFSNETPRKKLFCSSKKSSFKFFRHFYQKHLTFFGNLNCFTQLSGEYYSGPLLSIICAFSACKNLKKSISRSKTQNEMTKCINQILSQIEQNLENNTQSFRSILGQIHELSHYLDTNLNKSVPADFFTSKSVDSILNGLVDIFNQKSKKHPSIFFKFKSGYVCKICKHSIGKPKTSIYYKFLTRYADHNLIKFFKSKLSHCFSFERQKPKDRSLCCFFFRKYMELLSNLPETILIKLKKDTHYTNKSVAQNTKTAFHIPKAGKWKICAAILESQSGVASLVCFSNKWFLIEDCNVFVIHEVTKIFAKSNYICLYFYEKYEN